LMKHIFFLFILLFASQLYPEGFAGETKIKTEHGYTSIDRIFKNRTIICCSLKKYKSRTDKVFYTYKTRVPEFVQLEFTNHEIRCALDQQFYIRSTREWVSAQQIVHNRSIQNLF